jgi:hypothetical protein
MKISCVWVWESEHFFICILAHSSLSELCALCVLCGENLLWIILIIVRTHVSLMSFLPTHSSVRSSVNSPSASGESHSDSRTSVGVRLAR